MPPAARTGDLHGCPKTEPGNVAHLGGPIAPREGTVFIGYQPAARLGDKALCNGPTDTIKQGASNVFIEDMEAARVGDKTEHGGEIKVGCPTVRIGTTSQGAALMSSGAPLVKQCEPPEV